jgi:hypothetical protein
MALVSKFRVIDGGDRGPPDRHSRAARYQLEQAIIEILRALVRGDDARQRVSMRLAEFVREIANTETPLETIVSDAIAELHKELDHQGEGHIVEQERETIVLRALQVAAEAMATDDAAKGRLGGRQSRLRSAIEHQFIRREQRALKQRQEARKTLVESKAAPKQALDRRTKRKPKKPSFDDDPVVS